MNSEEWQRFRYFSCRVAVQVVSDALWDGEVPNRIEIAHETTGFEGDIVIVVPKRLLHRARWLISDSTMTEAELTYLATGELPYREPGQWREAG